MKCFNCRKKIDDGCVVCPFCGKYLNISDRPQGIPVKNTRHQGLGTFGRVVGIILMIIAFMYNTTTRLSVGGIAVWFGGVLLYAAGRYLKHINYALAAKNALLKQIKEQLAKENNDTVKLIAKSVVSKRVILSICFAGLSFFVSHGFFYTYYVIVLLPVLLLIYQSLFLRFNTIKTLYKKAKKYSDYHDISEIIAQETYNEKEDGKVVKAVLVSLAAFAVAIGCFIYLNLNSSFIIDNVDGGATLVQYKPGLLDIQKGVVIPEEIDNKKIVSISDNTFSLNIYIPSVVLPDTVTQIGESAFYDCRSLSQITLSPNITKLSPKAFQSCYSLESIQIPDAVGS